MTSSKKPFVIPSKGEIESKPTCWPNILTSIWFLLSETSKHLLGVNKKLVIIQAKDIHSLHNKEWQEQAAPRMITLICPI
jgi:hypothetical protein